MSGKIKRKGYILYVLRCGLYFLLNIMLVVVIFYGVFCLCRYGYNFCYGIFGPVVAEEPPGQDKYFEVDSGEDVFNIAERLKDEGIITDKYAFYIRTRLLDADKVIIKPGEYILNTSMDYETIIKMLTFNE